MGARPSLRSVGPCLLGRASGGGGNGRSRPQRRDSVAPGRGDPGCHPHGNTTVREYSPMSRSISYGRAWSVFAGAAAVAVTATAALLAPAQAAPGTTQTVTEANVSRQVEDTTPLASNVLYTR